MAEEVGDADEKPVVVVVGGDAGVVAADGGVGPGSAHEVGGCGNEEWEVGEHGFAVWRQRSGQETDGKEELIQQTSKCCFHCCDHDHDCDCDCDRDCGCCSWKKEREFGRKSGRLGLERSDEERRKRKSRKETVVAVAVVVGDGEGIEGSNRRGESGWRRGRTGEGKKRWRRRQG